MILDQSGSASERATRGTDGTDEVPSERRTHATGPRPRYTTLSWQAFRPTMTRAAFRGVQVTPECACRAVTVTAREARPLSAMRSVLSRSMRRAGPAPCPGGAQGPGPRRDHGRRRGRDALRARSPAVSMRRAGGRRRGREALRARSRRDHEAGRGAAPCPGCAQGQVPGREHEAGWPGAVPSAPGPSAPVPRLYRSFTFPGPPAPAWLRAPCTRPRWPADDGMPQYTAVRGSVTAPWRSARGRGCGRGHQRSARRWS
jgi:hypothetical protein